jgi:hypothetical protein
MNEETTQSLDEILNEPGAPLYNWKKILPAIDNEFKQSNSSEHRGALLQIFTSTMDVLESTVSPENLDEFNESRRKHYGTFIAGEALVGETICIDTLFAITNREIAAGRMTEAHSIRKIGGVRNFV